MISRAARVMLPAVFVGSMAVGIGVLVADPTMARGPVEIEIRIHYSRYEPSFLSIPAGVPVTLVIRNDDPIDHEWLIGDEAMHEVHRAGTEAQHDSRPTEISIPALATRRTTVTFDEPLTWRYICHLPGHEAYGMVGRLEAR